MSKKKKPSRSPGRKAVRNQQSIRGRAENIFNVVKSERANVCLTPEGKHLLICLWQNLNCSSLSEFLELLARGEFVVQRKPLE